MTVAAASHDQHRAAKNAVSLLKVALLRPPTTFPAYDEIFHAVADSLAQTGGAARTVHAVAEAASDDLLLVVGSPTIHPKLFAGLTALRQNARRPLVFLWHIEHLLDADMSWPERAALIAGARLDARFHHGGHRNTQAGNYLALREGVRRGLLDRVLVFTQRKTDFLRARGVDATYLPLGHHRVWGDTNAEDEAERDIDVLWLGATKGRRGAILKPVRAALAKHGVTIQNSYDLFPGGVWGEERNRLLRRAKIVLSVYRHPRDFSGMRISLAFASGALVVSEPVADPFPFTPGEHFIEAPPNKLADAILTYLKDDVARARICRAARERLETAYSLRASAEHILALVAACSK